MECTKRYRQWESEGAIAAVAANANTNAASSKLSGGMKSEKSSERGLSMRFNHLIIVGMSANNDEEVAREGLSLGMDGFIGKVWRR